MAFPTICIHLLPHGFLYGLNEVVLSDKTFLEVEDKVVPGLN
jgi:hypothetical protein